MKIALLGFSLLAVAWAEPLPRSGMVVRESRASPPAGFAHSGSAASDTQLSLRIQLHQGNMAGLEAELYAVSTPGNARYGQHLSKEEVEEYVKPTSETVSLVDEWLSGNGISSKVISPAGDWLQISLPVSKAGELLDAEFGTFTNEETGEKTIRTLAYSIPASLQGHVDLVHPTVAFPIKPTGGPMFKGPAPPLPKQLPPTGSNLTTRDVPASCASGTILPTCIQDLYGIPLTPATHGNNVLGVSGFINQFANEWDLEIFLFNFRTDIPFTTTFTLQTLDDGQNPQDSSDAGLEANLDIQYTIGLATDVPVTFISVGADSTDGLSGFLDEANFLLSASSPPTVLTTSYGWTENAVPASLQTSLCNAYMQLGARGVSLLFCSGDGGVAGFQPQSCTDFLPTFPANCPYITSVGATQNVPEIVATFSSGGFSDVFSQPSYQTNAVNAYKTSLGSEFSGLYNPSGRGFPDVSAIGLDLEIVLATNGELVFGTSCSSPIFASVVSLINDGLLSNGKSTMGFLNPFLYSSGGISGLNDITAGSNPGCGTNGFPAATGWDPISGLGTPNFPSLKAAAFAAQGL